MDHRRRSLQPPPGSRIEPINLGGRTPDGALPLYFEESALRFTPQRARPTPVNPQDLTRTLQTALRQPASLPPALEAPRRNKKRTDDGVYLINTGEGTWVGTLPGEDAATERARILPAVQSALAKLRRKINPSPGQGMRDHEARKWNQDLLLRNIVRCIKLQLKNNASLTLEYLTPLDVDIQCCGHPLCPSSDGFVPNACYYFSLGRPGQSRWDAKYYCISCLENLWGGVGMEGELPSPAVVEQEEEKCQDPKTPERKEIRIVTSPRTPDRYGPICDAKQKEPASNPESIPEDAPSPGPRTASHQARPTGPPSDPRSIREDAPSPEDMSLDGHDHLFDPPDQSSRPSPPDLAPFEIPMSLLSSKHAPSAEELWAVWANRVPLPAPTPSPLSSSHSPSLEKPSATTAARVPLPAPTPSPLSSKHSPSSNETGTVDRIALPAPTPSPLSHKHAASPEEPQISSAKSSLPRVRTPGLHSSPKPSSPLPNANRPSTNDHQAPLTRFQHLHNYIKPGESLTEQDKITVELWKMASAEQVTVQRYPDNAFEQRRSDNDWLFMECPRLCCELPRMHWLRVWQEGAYRQCRGKDLSAALEETSVLGCQGEGV